MKISGHLVGLSLSLLSAAVAVSPARGQNHAGPVFGPMGRNGGMVFGNGLRQGRFAHFPGRFTHLPRRHLIYPYAGYGPYFFYPGYDYDDGMVEPPPPPPRAAAQTVAPAVAAENAKPAESVVVELRGDHWVRLTSTGPVEIAPQAPPSGASVKALAAFDQTPASPPLPAAMLVFRDGHQEAAARYTIIGNTLYLKSDYWTSGSWTRKIPMSDLNIPATLKANQDRGTKFTLPSRPSEVILRP